MGLAPYLGPARYSQSYGVSGLHFPPLEARCGIAPPPNPGV